MTTASIKSRMGIAEWSMLIALSVLWGGSFFFVEVALVKFSPILIVAIRVSIAALCVWMYVFAKGLPWSFSVATCVAFLGMGLLNNVIPFVLIVWGQIEIAAGLASILNAAAPIFAVIIAGIWLKDEPISPSKIVGAVLGLVGVAILIGPGAIAGMSNTLLAQLAVLGAALSYAIAGVFGRRFTSIRIHPIVAAASQLLASSLIMIVLAVVFDNPLDLGKGDLKVWSAVVALAVFSTALAYVLYFQLLTRAGATNLMLVTLLIPVTAILLGSVFLGEQVGILQFGGMAVIALGLSAIDGRLWRWLKSDQ